MGWSKKNNGVELTEEQVNYLNILSEKLPFNIVVTSGFRTPERQAKAMFYKIEQGEDITQLYKDKVFAQSVIDAFPNIEEGAAAVQAYIDRGGGKTMHLSGNAIDLRTRDLTKEQFDMVVSTVEGMGDRILYEPVPPHFDISFRKDYTPKKKGFVIPLLLIGGLVWMVT